MKSFMIIALNTASSNEDKDILAAAGFPEADLMIGQYKGQTELSYKVELRNGYDFKKLIQVAREHNQESVMTIHDGYAEIIELNDTLNTMLHGKLVNNGNLEPQNVEGWTFDASTGDYYYIRSN